MKNLTKKTWFSSFALMALFVSCGGGTEAPKHEHAYSLQSNGNLSCVCGQSEIAAPYVAILNGSTVSSYALISNGSNSSIGLTVNGSDVSYTNTLSKKSVIIKTSISQNLTINAPNDDIQHVGEVKNLNIVAVANNSYVGNATVSGNVSVNSGHIVVNKTVSGSIDVVAEGSVSLDCNSSVSSVSLKLAEGTQTANISIGGTSSVETISTEAPVSLDIPVNKVEVNSDKVSISTSSKAVVKEVSISENVSFSEENKFTISGEGQINEVSGIEVSALESNGHIHVLISVISTEFLKEVATCTQPSIFYKSCSCGYISESTFENGVELGHSYDENGLCALCKANGNISSLSITDNTITGVSHQIIGNLTIPDSISAIQNNSFCDAPAITKILIPNKNKDSIRGAPWGAENVIVEWKDSSVKYGLVGGQVFYVDQTINDAEYHFFDKFGNELGTDSTDLDVIKNSYAFTQELFSATEKDKIYVVGAQQFTCGDGSIESPYIVWTYLDKDHSSYINKSFDNYGAFGRVSEDFYLLTFDYDSSVSVDDYKNGEYQIGFGKKNTDVFMNRFNGEYIQGLEEFLSDSTELGGPDDFGVTFWYVIDEYNKGNIIPFKGVENGISVNSIQNNTRCYDWYIPSIGELWKAYLRGDVQVEDAWSSSSYWNYPVFAMLFNGEIFGDDRTIYGVVPVRSF